MKHKSCPVHVKSGEGAGDIGASGEFEAIVSVFGNADSWGDVVMPGAFADSLAAWKASPDRMPVYWSHRMDDPRYNIGAVLEAEELAAGDPRIPEWADQHVKDHGGLWVKGQLDTGADFPIARMAGHLLRERRVSQFSFAYDVMDEVKNANGHNELRKLWIHEVSPTQVGMNQLTELIGAKSETTAPPDDAAGVKQYRPNAASIRARCDIAALEHEIAYPVS
jgi:hypothetical protein